MKKTVAGLTLALILAAGLIPVASGIVMQRAAGTVVQRVNQMNRDAGSDVSVSLASYDRGLLASTVRWEIDLGLIGRRYNLEKIVLREEADHGYTGIRSITRADETPAWAAFVRNHLKGKDPLYIETHYPLMGDVVYTLSLAAFSLEKDGTLFQVKPARASLILDRSLNRLEMALDWRGSSVPGSMEVEPIQVQVRMERAAGQIWQGTSLFSLSGVRVDAPSRSAGIRNLNTRSFQTYDPEKKRVSMGIDLSVDRVMKNREDLLTDAAAGLRINHLDAAAWMAMRALWTDMIRQAADRMQASGTGEPAEAGPVFRRVMAGFGFKLLGQADALLKKDFSIQVAGLSARLPQGPVRADIRLALKEDTSLVGLSPAMFRPSVLLDLLALDSSVELPARLAGQNTRLTSPVLPGMQTGLFIRSGDQLIHQAETRDGKLILNNRSVVLP